MSHFAVIVIGENIADQLEPYYEGSEDARYVKFVDREAEYLEEYQNASKDGVPLNQIYATFEEFVEDWYGEEGRDPLHNRYGRYANPNSKWDWWQVGGRWSEYFKKKGSDTWVNSLTVAELDFDGMVQAAIEEANAEYSKLEAILKGRPAPSWIEFLEKYPTPEEAREAYGALPVIKDLNAAHFYIFGGVAESFGRSREEYLERVKLRVLTPFAFVEKGIWYQKGDMGWFGMSSNEMDEHEWTTKFHQVLAALPAETRLTIIDCHI